MAVKVLIHRRGSVGQLDDLKPLLQRLRSLALAQPGYLSGESLQNVDDPTDSLVISIWSSAEEWSTWFHHPERAAVQNLVDALLGQETTYQVYQHA